MVYLLYCVIIHSTDTASRSGETPGICLIMCRAALIGILLRISLVCQSYFQPLSHFSKFERDDICCGGGEITNLLLRLRLVTGIFLNDDNREYTAHVLFLL